MSLRRHSSCLIQTGHFFLQYVTEKGGPEYKGVYQANNQMFLEHSGKGLVKVNREQDLNDEGLRKAKLSYHPVDFIKKYDVGFS